MRSAYICAEYLVVLPSDHALFLTSEILQKSVYRSEMASTKEPAVATLQSLVLLPAFCGPVKLSQIVKLYVEYGASLSMHNKSLTPLLKSIAKRVSSSVMLQVLYQLRPNLSEGNTRVG